MSELSNIFSRIKADIGLILLVLLIALLVFEGMILKTSVGLIYSDRYGDIGAKPSKSVRINFESYNGAVARIQGAASYLPTGPIRVNPFRILGK